MPDIVISNIADNCKAVVDTVCLPHQSLISLNSVLGKPGGGVRTISMTPMITSRMLNSVSTSVKDWEANVSADCKYDTAKKGSNALDAALARNLLSEVAFWLKRAFGAAFNDYHKFFDTIDINILLEQALYSEYPTTSLSLAVQQHLAPRVIQVSGFASKPVNITHSILAGCQQSVPLTRALLNKKMSQLAKDHPKAPPNVFVDDTSMACSAPRWSTVQNTLAPCLIQFAKCVESLNLSLSPKAVLSVSHSKLGVSLQKELKEQGIIFNVAGKKGARDLGITHTAGTSRPATITINRKQKIIQRKNRINQIAKINRRAKILYTGSAFPAETWGHQASGLSPSHVLAIERDAMRCTGIGIGYCRTIALRVYFWSLYYTICKNY